MVELSPHDTNCTTRKASNNRKITKQQNRKEINYKLKCCNVVSLIHKKKHFKVRSILCFYHLLWQGVQNTTMLPCFTTIARTIVASCSFIRISLHARTLMRGVHYSISVFIINNVICLVTRCHAIR